MPLPRYLSTFCKEHILAEHALGTKEKQRTQRWLTNFCVVPKNPHIFSYLLFLLQNLCQLFALLSKLGSKKREDRILAKKLRDFGF